MAVGNMLERGSRFETDVERGRPRWVREGSTSESLKAPAQSKPCDHLKKRQRLADCTGLAPEAQLCGFELDRFGREPS